MFLRYFNALYGPIMLQNDTAGLLSVSALRLRQRLAPNQALLDQGPGDSLLRKAHIVCMFDTRQLVHLPGRAGKRPGNTPAAPPPQHPQPCTIALRDAGRPPPTSIRAR